MQMENSTPYGYCKCGCGHLAPIADRTYNRRGIVKGQPFHYIVGHRHRLAVRWRVEDRGHTTPCWVYQGATRAGYARGAHNVTVHIQEWERVNGPVPDGLELDHLCRVRACVNPDHLEAVTRSENLRRSTRKLSQAERKLVAHMDTNTAVARYGISATYAWTLRQTYGG